MPLPNHPDKHGHPSVTTPEQVLDYRGTTDLESPPDTVVLTFQRATFEHAVDAYEGAPLPHAGASWKFHDLAGAAGVGVVGMLGVGGPATALTIEALVAHGVERILVVGHVGSLQPDVGLGDVIVVDGAIRDEGTSYHYLPASEDVGPAPSVRTRLASVARAADEDLHVGRTWTTDALYRETAPEIERYREAGVLCVEMEAATVFAVAAHRDVEAGVLFTVSDHVTPEGWDQRFADTGEHLTRLFDHVVEAYAR